VRRRKSLEFRTLCRHCDQRMERSYKYTEDGERVHAPFCYYTLKRPSSKTCPIWGRLPDVD
jgi:hypothetical protein